MPLTKSTYPHGHAAAYNSQSFTALKNPALSEHDRAWLATLEANIRDNLSYPMLSVSALAAKYSMSESSLLRKVRQLTGFTPQQYILEIRLHEACHLLKQKKHGRLAEVANAVGYADARSFSRSFKDRFGCLPSRWPSSRASIVI